MYLLSAFQAAHLNLITFSPAPVLKGHVCDIKQDKLLHTLLTQMFLFVFLFFFALSFAIFLCRCLVISLRSLKVQFKHPCLICDAPRLVGGGQHSALWLAVAHKRGKTLMNNKKSPRILRCDGKIQQVTSTVGTGHVAKAGHTQRLNNYDRDILCHL